MSYYLTYNEIKYTDFNLRFRVRYKFKVDQIDEIYYIVDSELNLLLIEYSEEKIERLLIKSLEELWKYYVRIFNLDYATEKDIKTRRKLIDILEEI